MSYVSYTLLSLVELRVEGCEMTFALYYLHNRIFDGNKSSRLSSVRIGW